jgi:hypothetical protein
MSVFVVPSLSLPSFLKFQPSKRVWLSLLAFALAGCVNQPRLGQSVQEPPYIPNLPEAIAPLQNTEVPVSFSADIPGQYTDISSLGEDEPLKAAVRRAVQRGVLKPSGPDARFNPESPVSYAEFRQWVLAYQTPLTDMEVRQERIEDGVRELLPKGTLPSSPKETGVMSPMDPRKLTALPETLTVADRPLEGRYAITREAFCQLYVTLSHQEGKAKALSPEAIESMTPGGSKMDMDEAMQLFKDYATIPVSSRSFVALAYRDKILGKIFGLNPNRLTLEEGFGPKRPVSRAQAILLLDTLYGTKPVASMNSVSSGNVKPVDRKELESGMPRPLGHFEAIQVKTPQGSRSAVRVTGAE